MLRFNNFNNLQWLQEYHIFTTVRFYSYNYVQIGEVGSFYYGPEHPMKPFRIKMTHQLILSYGLYRKMSVYVCKISLTKIFFSNLIELQTQR